jgi:hypothetical protein
MSLSFLFKRLLSADIQTQIEAGYLTNEGKLTDEGKTTLLQEFYGSSTLGGSALLTARATDLIARRKADAEKA